MRSSVDSLEVTGLSTAVLVLLLSVWLLLGRTIRSRFLTEGSLAALMGLTAGILLLIFKNYLPQGVVKRLTVFDPSVFLVYLLPPVILHAGLGMEKKLFFSNLGTILCMGIAGTVVCFLVMSGFLLAFTQFQVLRVQDCLALGAIFSATDSVTTLQVLDSQTMPLLFSLVFGEGVINDATSVVLLGAVISVYPPSSATSSDSSFPPPLAPILSQPLPPSPLPPQMLPPLTPDVANGSVGVGLLRTLTDDYGDDNHTGASGGFGILRSFLYLLSTSLILGLVAGLTIAFLIRWIRDQPAHQELALVGMLSYLCYLAAEVFGLSGILALFCCGIAVSQWAMPSMSMAGAAATTTAIQTLSHLAEGIIFLYVGMDAVDPVKWGAAYASEAVPLCLTLIVLLLVSRALGVVPMALLHNMWSPVRLTNTDLFIIWWSGLMRGAVSVALVYYYFDTQNVDGHLATVIVSTLVVVLFTTLVFGMLTKPLMLLLLEERPERPLWTVFKERWEEVLRCTSYMYRRVSLTFKYTPVPHDSCGEVGLQIRDSSHAVPQGQSNQEDLRASSCAW
ncbi:hypothetical protein CEUSTIGMA_g8304.t1 [Chlamydomonas eustigma]|uniref:Cation/H+ exchanger transmembrane domain-containing protein n=1 Tax=Chlamydomonas eustigma TaxID=1157962 RepID=A0A250XD92_9CHLO|nr:hypothetical protein CEUSTIGMA_g8304.t1 [Chlamydomonas eustigma]|eukprot:GAX80869.1 hypothetical protein CEUSTIGMA_g8304.t1 [Chlamydomonas eustigma]